MPTSIPLTTTTVGNQRRKKIIVISAIERNATSVTRGSDLSIEYESSTESL